MVGVGRSGTAAGCWRLGGRDQSRGETPLRRTGKMPVPREARVSVAPVGGSDPLWALTTGSRPWLPSRRPPGSGGGQGLRPPRPGQAIRQGPRTLRCAPGPGSRMGTTARGAVCPSRTMPDSRVLFLAPSCRFHQSHLLRSSVFICGWISCGVLGAACGGAAGGMGRIRTRLGPSYSGKKAAFLGNTGVHRATEVAGPGGRPGRRRQHEAGTKRWERSQTEGVVR